MLGPKTGKKSLTIIQQLLETLKVIEKNLPDLILIFFLLISGILSAMIIVLSMYYLPIMLKFIGPHNLFAYNIATQASAYFFYLIIAILAQIMIINKLQNPQINFINNLKGLKKYFLNFFCLTIVTNLIFFLAAMPLYVGFVLFFLLGKYVLGGLSLLTGLLAISLVVSYLIFSPFILIGSNQRCINSIKKSIELTKNKLGNVLIKILVLCGIIAILNSLSSNLISFHVIGRILSAFVFVFMLIFTFVYLFVMYRDFNNLKNAG